MNNENKDIKRGAEWYGTKEHIAQWPEVKEADRVK